MTKVLGSNVPLFCASLEGYLSEFMYFSMSSARIR